MAEQNKPETHGDFYSEILSPSELFAARSRSHKIPVRGQKDFFPDDSKEQRQRLEQSLSEHWSLVSEERVERLGSLVRATWIPEEQIVELQSPAGKFWQTMGFSAHGRQYLLPEEALYLMECGSVQVFDQELPLSIQDGYERFLSPQTVTLQQYQVFGHLKRLGYVVHRFDPSSEQSSYAKKLNLPQSRDKSGRQLKRKRSTSPTPSTKTSTGPSCSGTEQHEEPTTDKMEVDECNPKAMEDENLPEASQQSPAAQITKPNLTDSDTIGRSWWTPMDVPEGPDHSFSSLASSRWDFDSISFPDLGSSQRRPPDCLSAPDPTLLPRNLSVGVCDVAPWRQKVNLRVVKMSHKDQQREEEESRSKRDVNRDKEVRRCRNWSEYQELQARRRGERGAREEHLWNREVTPLHDPDQPTTAAELLEKISIIKSTNLLEGASRLEVTDEWRIHFNVYQPDTAAEFKKSNPGTPHCRMCVCSFDDPVPDLRAMKILAFQSGDVSVVVAVVDQGDISFFTFKDFQLPTDIYP